MYAFITAFYLGELDRAFVWLDRAVAHGQTDFRLYSVEFDAVRNDPRFQAALSAMERSGHSDE